MVLCKPKHWGECMKLEDMKQDLESAPKVKNVSKKVEQKATVREIVIEPEKKDESGNSLWCTTCQRGMDGLEIAKDKSAGDDCPLCEQKAAIHELGKDRIGVLKLVSQVREEVEELATIKARERELRKLKSIKSPGDMVKDEARAREKETAALKGEIASLRSMVEKLTK